MRVLNAGQARVFESARHCCSMEHLQQLFPGEADRPKNLGNSPNNMGIYYVSDRYNMGIYLIHKQVLNPQKAVSGTHSFKLIHIYIAPMVNSWRSESSNVSFVVLEKLLFGFPER